MLTPEQVEQFHRDGFLIVREAIPADVIAQLQRTTDILIDRTRNMTESDEYFDLEPNHTAAEPRLRRISHPVTLDDVYWQTATSDAVLPNVAALLGRNVKFHHSKLNTKVGGGGTQIGWHQDFAFFPHTNYGLLACGIAIDPSTLRNGCLMVVPGSHHGPLLSHRRDDGEFVGVITDAAQVDEAKAVPVELQPGDMSIHHAMTIHGSARNDSTDPRRLLIFQYAATDAVQLDRRPLANEYSERVVLGDPATHARLAGPVTLPLRGQPKGRSLFDAQKAAMGMA